MKFQNWIDDIPSPNHEDGRTEVIGLFEFAEGVVQARIQARTSDPAAWKRIMEAIETVGNLNLGLDTLPREPDGSYRYGIDLVGHRVEYVVPPR